MWVIKGKKHFKYLFPNQSLAHYQPKYVHGQDLKQTSLFVNVFNPKMGMI